MRNGSTRIGAAIPANLRDGLEELARQNDRSISAELRRAIAEHLSEARTSEGHESGSQVPLITCGPAPSREAVEA